MVKDRLYASLWAQISSGFPPSAGGREIGGPPGIDPRKPPAAKGFWQKAVTWPARLWL